MKSCPNKSCQQVNPQELSAFTRNKSKKDGLHSWCKQCVKVSDKKRYPKIKAYRDPYIVHKKTFCEKCGFVAEHSCQLDVDHVDGNHANNDVSNLQTLCANCHRLKTQIDRNFFKKLPINHL